MPKVEDVRVLNIDGVPRAVDSMSDVVKKMVAIFNEWAQREADARDELMLVQAAKQDLSRQIITQIRQEQEAAQQQATKADSQPPEVTPPAPAAPAPTPAAPAVTPVNTTEVPSTVVPVAKGSTPEDPAE